MCYAVAHDFFLEYIVVYLFVQAVFIFQAYVLSAAQHVAVFIRGVTFMYSMCCMFSMALANNSMLLLRYTGLLYAEQSD